MKLLWFYSVSQANVVEPRDVLISLMLEAVTTCETRDSPEDGHPPVSSCVEPYLLARETCTNFAFRFNGLKYLVLKLARFCFFVERSGADACSIASTADCSLLCCDELGHFSQ
jgi:hypothetical protein